MFTAAGAAYVVPDFIAAQNANGSLLPMAEQVRRAIAWAYKNAIRFGGDRNRIHVSGHSSGGHLCAVALMTDWNDHGVPADVIKSALCVSGIYDLKPVRLSARSSYVRFNDAIEEQLSPIRHLDKLHTPVVVAYGSNETPEFQRQNRDFAAAVQAAGKPVQIILGENYNHFELVETLANPQGILGRAALAQMKLGPA
jgi:arylformamidase